MPEPAETAAQIVGLGARVHLFVRPEFRDAFTRLFSED